MVKPVGVVVLMTVSFIAGTFVPVAHMQRQLPAPSSGDYVVMSFIRPRPGGAAPYIALERDLWKPAHQARVADGKAKSWALWQKRFAGTDDGYGFATVQTYARFEDIDVSMTEYVQKANPGTSLEEIQRRTQEAREITRTEVWRVLEQTK
jgi:hypothetical protein